jgi:hypothetical protein
MKTFQENLACLPVTDNIALLELLDGSGNVIAVIETNTAPSHQRLRRKVWRYTPSTPRTPAPTPASIPISTGFLLSSSAAAGCRPASSPPDQFAGSMISKSWVISAVLPSITDAEQYLSADNLMARSTCAGLRPLPVTT